MINKIEYYIKYLLKNFVFQDAVNIENPAMFLKSWNTIPKNPNYDISNINLACKILGSKKVIQKLCHVSNLQLKTINKQVIKN